MQRFTLLHDGSDQGWHATYLAFHIAAQLGAPLSVLLVDPTTDQKILARRAAQVEVGGRAAGLAIETRLVKNFSVSVVMENTSNIDGFFVPHRLVPNGKTVLGYLEALSCPIWIVAHEAKTHKMAVLVSDLTVDEKLISFTAALSLRLQQSLTGLVKEGLPNITTQINSVSAWIQLPGFSHNEIASALDQHGIDLLFVPASRASLIDTASFNCALFPF